MFAELSRRMGLPLFGSARRDAAAGRRALDDEVIAAVDGRPARRRPWAEVRAAPYGMRDDSVAPGWLVPGRLPHRLDLAPPSSPPSSPARGASACRRDGGSC